MIANKLSNVWKIIRWDYNKMIVVVLLGGEIMSFSYNFQCFVQGKSPKIYGQWTDMTYL